MRRAACAIAAGLALYAPAPASALDCLGQAGDPAPGTAAWEAREAANVVCGEQRALDLATNPPYLAALARVPRTDRLGDPLRDPAHHAGKRFRYDELVVAGRPGAVFRPLAPGPHPAVVVVHGGAANQEMYWWASEMLAEAGYLVLTFQIPNTARTHTEELRRVLDVLLSPEFRFASEVDSSRVGVAGHSAGGVAVSRVGQEDLRVKAVVSWDRAQSTELPYDVTLRTPALYVVADFNCQQVPVCLPVRYAGRQDPRGPGSKDDDFVRTAAAGVDTMKLSLRAATHLDFSVLPAGVGSRYGQAVTSYFTLAWFDRYLRGDPAAAARLTAPRFDESADRHAIGGGTFESLSGRNRPVRLGGLAVRDRLSFHWRTAWSLDSGSRACADVRRGCP